MPPEPGAWSVFASATGTKFHIEHIADDEPENPQPYKHVQDLFVSELVVTVLRGLTDHLGLEVQVPFRVVRDRVHYLDLARQAYAPPNPGLHHRNETLTGVSDPQVAASMGHQWIPWTVAGRAGVSIPLGRTQPNPFELGRRGLWHQHIQFGTGTWDPVLGLAVGHTAGPIELELSGTARLAFGENTHGYRAGNRYGVQLGATPDLGVVWSANAGLLLAREETEKWGGVVEEEGNLGRTDLFLSLGGGRIIPGAGAVALNVQFPLMSESTGEQVDIPIIFSVTWTK